ncbi:hypothetical protein [Paraburkholderia kururiensis]|uniref:HEPN domain-containing protein n=1 Tax=Paraburkholderia kururiensis TaxID=984307 RepID=A0ABZ0WS95_9BURK|nr:hypothetical protein [Paraburkholderia kururiensis]WQD80280.1 hypothetical protein U0042_11680 [Paraburkholderia kururiensis]
MSIGVSDLLALAGQLANGAVEAEWRSGASRAYYGAFHKALEVADANLPPSPQSLGEHEKLTERLKAHSMKGRSLAYVLIDLKKVRTHADYHLSMPFAQKEATDLVASCHAFLPKADLFAAYVKANP